MVWIILSDCVQKGIPCAQKIKHKYIIPFFEVFVNSFCLEILSLTVNLLFVYFPLCFDEKHENFQCSQFSTLLYGKNVV